MIAELNRLWRLAGTGLAFALMGIGALILAIGVFPPLSWASRDPVRRQRRIQDVVQRSFAFYIGLLRGLGIIALDISGGDGLSRLRGKLVVANHPTLLDVVILMALVPRVQCVVKHQIWTNPFLKLAVRGAGYIRNDLAPDAFIARCTEALAAGSNLVIFPEGTRTVPGEPLRIKRGFANIATLAKVDVQLVTITCRPLTLTKGEAWYHIPPVKPLFHIDLGRRLDIAPYLGYRFRSRAARRLVDYTADYYLEKLG